MKRVRSQRVAAGPELRHEPKFPIMRGNRSLDAADGHAAPERGDDRYHTNQPARAMAEEDMSQAGNQPRQESHQWNLYDRCVILLRQEALRNLR